MQRVLILVQSTSGYAQIMGASDVSSSTKHQ